jgi:hypothetical protein
MSYIISTPLWLFLHKALGAIKTSNQQLWYWLSVPLVVFLILISLGSIRIIK